MLIRSFSVALTALAVFLHASGPARAEWPERVIRLVVPFPAGSSSDTIARIIAAKLTTQLQQQVIVEDKPGGSTIIGTNLIAKSAPDGYTLGLANTSSHAVTVALAKDIPFDPVKDFTPIAMIGSSPLVLLAPAQGSAKTFQDFVKLAKENPQKLTYASAGTATLTHLAGELVKSKTGINVVHVPYRGTEQSMIDLISGRIDMLVGTIAPSLSQLKADKIRAFAIMSDKRSPLIPEVPTIAEAGAPDCEAALWTGLVAPTGLPPAIVARLNQAVNMIVNAPDVQEALSIQGVTPETGSPEALAEKIRTDVAKWKKVAVDANIGDTQ
jgi:tripartite-type tricarboxylate transporter receptor subunit TctC